MAEFFRLRGYPERIITDTLTRVIAVDRNRALTPQATDPTDRLRLILTFHPHNLPVKRILLKNLHILRDDETTQHLMSEPPMVIYRRDTNLQDLVVHSRLLHDPVPGTRPCRRRICYTCPYVIPTTEVTFPKSPFIIKESFTCETRNMLYAIQCKRCNILYIGETGRSLSERFREHLRDTKNEDRLPVPLHFNSPDHRGVEDISIFGLRRCQGGEYSRFIAEQRLIYTLGTLTTRVLNVKTLFKYFM